MFDPLVAGRLKTLAADELTPRRAETGIVISAVWRLCGAVKKVAVSIVSYVPAKWALSAPTGFM